MRQKNRNKKQFEITIIKIEYNPDNKEIIKHYYNYKRDLNDADIREIKENFKAGSWQVRITDLAGSLSSF